MISLRKTTQFLAMIFVGMFLLATPACKNDVTFAEENKTAIDTMFVNRKNVMRIEIDSLCSINNAAFYQAAFDSILDARIAQIEKTLEAIKSKTK